jgi:hypothetical protein
MKKRGAVVFLGPSRETPEVFDLQAKDPANFPTGAAFAKQFLPPPHEAYVRGYSGS